MSLWDIPIMGADERTQIGTISIQEDGDAVIEGWIYGEPTRISTRPEEPPSILHFVLPEPPATNLPTHIDLAAARELVESIQDRSWLDDEWHREAAARGRKVHEDALVLMEQKGLDYHDAIEEVLRGRDDA